MKIESHFPSLRIALAAVLFAATATAQTSQDLWKLAKGRPDLFTVAGADAGVPGQPSILLIGENHASVKTQTQLADLLDGLYASHSVDAILVEGSNGLVDPSTLRNSLAKYDAQGIRNFLRGQLELGQLAGYEYVSLTRPGVRVWGVEDLEARGRYVVDAARRSAKASLDDQAALHTRAVGIAKAAIAGASPTAARTADVDGVLSRYQAAISGLNEFARTEGKNLADAEADYAGILDKYTRVFAKLEPVLPAYNAVFREMVPYRAAADKVKAAGTPSAAVVAEFTAAKAKVEKATEALDAAAKKVGYKDVEALLADTKQLGELQKSIQSSEDRLTKLSNTLGKLESNLENHFFLAANAARNTVGHPVPELQSFLRVEREKAAASANDPEKPYLTERDKFMVANTMAYLKANPTVKNVVLIIGYAHLEGMTKRLAQEKVPVVAGKIASSEEPTEPWENRAWARRRNPFPEIFRTNKEVTRLQDQTYQVQLPKLVGSLLASKGLPGELGGTGGRKALVLVSPEEQKANWGSQVVNAGKMPDASGKTYQLVDRDLAQTAAKALSTNATTYGSAYFSKDSQGRTTVKMDLPTGTVDVATARNSVPTGNQVTPNRVVVAVEGKEDAFLKLWLADSQSRTPWTSRLSKSEGAKPSWLFTKNMTVAARHIEAIEKQDPLKIGNVATFRFPGDGSGGGGNDSFDHMWFTPEPGDHARVLLVVGHNSPEFRAALKVAASEQKFKNKQVALATCFDPIESQAISDMLLDAGALMVWSPSQTITPGSAEKLANYMQKVDTQQNPVRGLDNYINRTLELWHQTEADDADLKLLLDSVSRAKLDAVGIQRVLGD